MLSGNFLTAEDGLLIEEATGNDFFSTNTVSKSLFYYLIGVVLTAAADGGLTNPVDTDFVVPNVGGLAFVSSFTGAFGIPTAVFFIF